MNSMMLAQLMRDMQVRELSGFSISQVTQYSHVNDGSPRLGSRNHGGGAENDE